MQNRTNTTSITIDDVVDAVNSTLPNLPDEKSYTLEELVGEQYWSTIPKGPRISLGQAFKALAVGGMLPVSYTGSTSSNKSLYEHK
jgi:hypothetical protein